MVALLLVGTAMLCGGLLTVVYGISIKEFGLGSTMIISGAVVTCTGLLLMGLALVVRELKNLALGLGSGVVVTDLSDAERPGTVIPTAMIPHADIRPTGKPDFATAPPPPRHAPLETSPSRLETSRLEGARLETPRPETRPSRAAPRGSAKSDFLFAREEPINPDQAPERPAPDRFERPHPLAPSSPSAAQPPSAPWQDDPSAFAPPRAPERATERDFERTPEPAASRPPRREFLFASKRRDAQSDTPAASEAEPHPLAQESARTEPDQPEPSWRPAAPAAPVEPEPEAAPAPLQAEPAEPHYQPPRRSEAAPVTVVKSGVVDAMAYSLYSDGSIEAQMPEGMVRFESIEELRAHLDQRGA